MNAELVVRRGVLAVAFAGLLAGGSYAQSPDPTPQQQDMQNDKKDIRSDKKDLAKDRADRNADQRDINHDKGDLAKDRSDRNADQRDRKSTRLNSSHTVISYAVFCLKK